MRRMKSRVVAIVAIVALLVNMAAPAYAQTPMIRVYVSITASDGSTPIPGVTKYQSPPTGSVANFGQGVEGGMLYHDFPATTTNVKVWTSYNGTTSSQVIQNVATNPVFSFRTNKLTLKLITCDGTPLAGGRARMKVGTTTMYFPPSGAVPTGADGKTSAEVFPGTYDFEMSYNSTAQWKYTQVVPNAAHEIVWTTTKVTLSWPGAISYGGSLGDGRFFTKPSMELMPSTVRFHFRAYTGTPGFTTDLSFSGCSFTYPQVDQPPTADAGGPYTVLEGDDVMLMATGSDPEGTPVTFAWDLNNDGVFETAGQSATFATLKGTSDHIVSVRVTDAAGLVAVDSATVHVENVAPTVGAISVPPGPLAPGAEFEASASFTDPGVLDTHDALWDWGDGSTSPAVVEETGGSGLVRGTHAYSESGSYVVKLSVVDDDGGVGEAYVDHLFVNAPPQVDAGGPYVILEGEAAELAATGSDPEGTPVMYDWDLDGDGVFEIAGQSATFAGVDGTRDHVVSVRAIDAAGLVAIDSATVHVDNVAPSVGAIDAPAGQLAPGAEFEASAQFTDPGVLDTHDALWDWGDGTTSAGDVTETDGSGSVAGTHAYAASGDYVITLTVTDKDGDVGETTFAYVVVNVAPVADAGGSYTVAEGSEVQLDATLSSDADGDIAAYEWDLDNDGEYDDATGATPTWSFADDGVYPVSVRVTDDDGASSTDSAMVTVSNVAPTVGPITAPLTPLAVGTSFNVSAPFTDPGVLDTHSAVWDWGDGSTSAGVVSESGGSGSVNGTHAYAAAGVYTLKLTVTDKDGGSTSALYEYVVAYDPSAGFVTGGGWIDSPAGAYAANPALVGKATFGFVAKYKKGATVPDGNTQFQFKAGDLNFKSTSYEWLVVAGKTAKFKGEGTINGQGSYKFMISAVDGSPDTFRIQIWDEAESVYDNGSQQALRGGSIVVHN